MKKNLIFLLLSLFILPLAAQWSSTQKFPGNARDGVFSFVIDNKAYVGGGILRHDHYRYDALLNKWDTLNNIGNDSNRCFSIGFAVGGSGYVVGGDFNFGEATDEVWSYTPATDSWTQKNDFPGGIREGMLAFVIGSRVFIGGGCQTFDGAGISNAKKDFYEYHAATDTWTQLADLPYNVAFASSFVAGSSGFMIFGTDGATYHNQLYSFDTLTMAWAVKTPFPGGSRAAGTAFGINGRGYAGQGEKNLVENYTDFYEYDPAGDSWHQLTDYPGQSSAWGISWVMGNNAYVGTGLELSSFNFSDELYLFSPAVTGIYTRAASAAGIYPNPVKSSFTITGTDGAVPAAIKITDMAGKETGFYPVVNNSVNISVLAPGLYIVELGAARVKIVKE